MTCISYTGVVMLTDVTIYAKRRVGQLRPLDAVCFDADMHARTVLICDNERDASVYATAIIRFRCVEDFTCCYFAVSLVPLLSKGIVIPH